MDAATLIDASGPPRAQPPAGLLSRELQELWFALAGRRWSSLLIVPASGVASALPLATGLLHISRRTGAEPRTSLLDGTRASLEHAASLCQQLAARVSQGERVLAVVDPVEENPAALAIAAACEAALLCLALGSSDVASARRTIERCGRGRFVGSAVLVAEGQPQDKSWGSR